MEKKVHKEIKCDYVVCWENDFPTCPVEMINLKDEIGQLKK